MTNVAALRRPIREIVSTRPNLPGPLWVASAVVLDSHGYVVEFGAIFLTAPDEQTARREADARLDQAFPFALGYTRSFDVVMIPRHVFELGLLRLESMP